MMHIRRAIVQQW